MLGAVALVIDSNAPSVLSVTSTKANGGYVQEEQYPSVLIVKCYLNRTRQIMMETGSNDQAASYKRFWNSYVGIQLYCFKRG